MKKLLINITLLLLIVLILNKTLFSFFHLPFFWGIDYERYCCYKQKWPPVNALFLGSSLTGRQVLPSEFDSLNAASNVKTISYNFGLDASDPAELFANSNQVLNQADSTLKYLIVELMPVIKFDNTRLHLLRFKSNFDTNQFINYIGISLFSNLPFLAKLETILSKLTLYIEFQYKFGFLENALKFKQNQSNINCRNDSLSGFTPCISTTSPEVTFEGKMFKNPHLKFLNEQLNTFRLNEESAQNILTNKTYFSTQNPNRVYATLIMQLLATSNAKHVKMLFVLPPRLSKEDYSYLVPIYNSLPETIRIELANSYQYPEFYTIKNSYDLLHLNKSGAEIYTSELSKKFCGL